MDMDTVVICWRCESPHPYRITRCNEKVPIYKGKWFCPSCARKLTPKFWHYHPRYMAERLATRLSRHRILSPSDIYRLKKQVCTKLDRIGHSTWRCLEQIGGRRSDDVGIFRGKSLVTWDASHPIVVAMAKLWTEKRFTELPEHEQYLILMATLLGVKNALTKYRSSGNTNNIRRSKVTHP